MAFRVTVRDIEVSKSMETNYENSTPPLPLHARNHSPIFFLEYWSLSCWVQHVIWAERPQAIAHPACATNKRKCSKNKKEAKPYAPVKSESIYKYVELWHNHYVTLLPRWFVTNIAFRSPAFPFSVCVCVCEPENIFFYFAEVREKHIYFAWLLPFHMQFCTCHTQFLFSISARQQRCDTVLACQTKRENVLACYSGDLHKAVLLASHILFYECHNNLLKTQNISSFDKFSSSFEFCSASTLVWFVKGEFCNDSCCRSLAMYLGCCSCLWCSLWPYLTARCRKHLIKCLSFFFFFLTFIRFVWLAFIYLVVLIVVSVDGKIIKKKIKN